MKKTIKALQDLVQVLNSGKDLQAVQLSSLGFKDNADAGAWLELQGLVGAYRLVVDYYTMMQHMWVTMTCEDIIKRLVKGYRLDIATGINVEPLCCLKE